MNKIYVIGNLTRDPETRHTTSGISVCNFSVAVNRRFINQQTGQREVDFFNVVAWRQLGELCQQYLAKGRKVAVTGSMQSRTYQAQDGSTRTAWDLVADEIEFLSPAATATQNTNASAAPAAAPNYDAAPPVVADAGMHQVDDDELPF
jgi:single-strand DNA-binding protein